MKRRNFIKKGALTGSFLAFGGWSIGLLGKERKMLKPESRFHYAPYPGTFERLAGNDPVDQVLFMAEQGFTAFEDPGMRLRPVEEQLRIGEVIRKNSLRAGLFVAHTIYWTQPNLTSGKSEWRNEFLNEIRNSVTVAKRIGAKWMSVIPGYSDCTLDKSRQTANMVESLKQAAAILEPEGLVMVLEPINFKNDPGLFLTTAAQAYEICRAVNSPSCKFIYNLSNQEQKQTFGLTELVSYWDEIASFQIDHRAAFDDSFFTDPGYNQIFNFIKSKGYTGIIGVALSNPVYGKAEVLKLLKRCRF